MIISFRDLCDACGTELMDCGVLGVECPNRDCPDNIRLMKQVREIKWKPDVDPLDEGDNLGESQDY